VVAFTTVDLVAKAAGDGPSTAAFQFQRAAIQKQLESSPGLHLVVVRYSAGHVPTQEWVYNAADINGSKVVWAREMSPMETARLLEYFRNRTVWLLEPDAPTPEIRAYVLPAASGFVASAPLKQGSEKSLGPDRTNQ